MKREKLFLFPKQNAPYRHTLSPVQRPQKDWRTAGAVQIDSGRSYHDLGRSHLLEDVWHTVRSGFFKTLIPYKRSKHLNSESAVVWKANKEMWNVTSIPSTSAAVGISLALICEAQSLCWRVEEHFLVKSSKLSNIFLWSSSCKTLQEAKHFVFLLQQIQTYKLIMR